MIGKCRKCEYQSFFFLARDTGIRFDGDKIHDKFIHRGYLSINPPVNSIECRNLVLQLHEYYTVEICCSVLHKRRVTIEPFS